MLVRQPANRRRCCMSAIAIRRATHDKDHPFTLISSAIARAMPVEALGLLVKLLSFGDGWEVDRARLQRDFNVTPGEVKRLLPRLVERGHLAYEKPRDPLTGKYTGETVWTVTEQPATAAKVHVVEIDHVETDPLESDTVETGSVEIDTLENQPVGFVGGHGTRAESNNLDSSNQDLEILEKQSLRAGARETSPTVPPHPYLVEFVEKLGDLGGFGPLLEAEIARLGSDEARATLLGCGSAGSWQYLLTALKRRKTPDAPSPRSAGGLSLRPLSFPPLGGVWVTSCLQINDPAARHALSFGANITEPEPQAVQVMPGVFDGDLLAADGVQAAIAMLRDMDIRVDIVQRPPDAITGWVVDLDAPTVQAGAA
jgi:hypothetical protein